MQYDAIVIGAGQAGPSLSAFFAGQGQKVALIEGNIIGGSCVNYGCTPTKTMRASARIAYQARRGTEFGVHVGDVNIDFSQVIARREQVVGKSRDGLIGWLEGTENLDIYHAYAHFLAKENGLFQVQAGNEVLEAERVYLNVGTRAAVPPIEGIESVPYLLDMSLMELRELPEHLLILGGSYIGLEMGQIFRRLGSKVSIVEFAPALTPREDADVSAEIERIMKNEGIDIYTGHKATAVEKIDDWIRLFAENQAGETIQLEGSHLLVAVGRKSNADKLNLEAIGLETDKRGFIPTNGKLETAIEGIFALGDVNGRGAFTHTSYHDYEIVRDNWLGANRSADERIMAYSMYTDPPLGRVGMSEKEARDSGRKVLGMRHYAKDVSRAKEDGELNGIVKILVDADSEEILGATTFIMQGDDVIQVVSNFMATGSSYKVMKEALPIHPTISEYFPTWLGMLEPLD